MSRCGIGITVAVMSLMELMTITTKYCLYPHDVQQEEKFHFHDPALILCDIDYNGSNIFFP